MLNLLIVQYNRISHLLCALYIHIVASRAVDCFAIVFLKQRFDSIGYQGFQTQFTWRLLKSILWCGQAALVIEYHH